MYIEDVKKAIHVLRSNQACVILDMPNGDTHKGTTEFLDACDIAIDIMGDYLEKKEWGNE